MKVILKGIEKIKKLSPKQKQQLGEAIAAELGIDLPGPIQWLMTKMPGIRFLAPVQAYEAMARTVITKYDKGLTKIAQAHNDIVEYELAIQEYYNGMTPNNKERVSSYKKAIEDARKQFVNGVKAVGGKGYAEMIATSEISRFFSFGREGARAVTESEIPVVSTGAEQRPAIDTGTQFAGDEQMMKFQVKRLESRKKMLIADWMDRCKLSEETAKITLRKRREGAGIKLEKRPLTELESLEILPIDIKILEQMNAEALEAIKQGKSCTAADVSIPPSISRGAVQKKKESERRKKEYQMRKEIEAKTQKVRERIEKEAVSRSRKKKTPGIPASATIKEPVGAGAKETALGNTLVGLFGSPKTAVKALKRIYRIET